MSRKIKRFASELRLGMEADRALQLMRRHRVTASRGPRVLGNDRLGMVVRWTFPGLTVELKRRRARRGLGPLAYRIARIEGKYVQG